MSCWTTRLQVLILFPGKLPVEIVLVLLPAQGPLPLSGQKSREGAKQFQRERGLSKREPGAPRERALRRRTGVAPWGLWVQPIHGHSEARAIPHPPGPPQRRQRRFLFGACAGWLHASSWVACFISILNHPWKWFNLRKGHLRDTLGPYWARALIGTVPCCWQASPWCPWVIS